MSKEIRLCTLTIVIDDRKKAASEVNHLLSEFGDKIVARLGLPKLEARDSVVSVICVVLEIDADAMGALSGKLGQIEGIKVKSIMI